jgi:hypothetical protein
MDLELHQLDVKCERLRSRSPGREARLTASVGERRQLVPVIVASAAEPVRERLGGTREDAEGLGQRRDRQAKTWSVEVLDLQGPRRPRGWGRGGTSRGFAYGLCLRLREQRSRQFT